MKKLLIISSNTIHVLNYINLIRDYFNEIVFITNEKNENFDYGNIKIYYTEFSIRKPFSFFKSIGFIKKIIKEFNPSIIHSHQITTNSLLALLANKKTMIPAVYTAWGSDILYTPNTGFFYKKMVKYILQNAKYFTSDSVFMADEMNRMADKQLNTLIANFGINIENNQIVEKQNIIYSNRQLKSLYRIDKIIEAFAKFIKNSKENWKLIVGAEGEEKNNIIALAEKLELKENIEFVGWLPKEKNSYYYNVSKYYVSIPESDATSISLLEAMAAGCIPILSDLPANREWIENGLNGVIVSDLESNFILKAFEIDFDKAQLINKSIIEEKGTKEANRKKFINFYERIF